METLTSDDDTHPPASEGSQEQNDADGPSPIRLSVIRRGRRKRPAGCFRSRVVSRSTNRRRATRRVLRPAFKLVVRRILCLRRPSPMARFRLVAKLVERILRFHAAEPALTGSDPYGRSAARTGLLRFR